MYQLVVADDDPIIRRSLETRYDWAAMGFEVAGAFSDGSDVIEYLKTHRADAVLTDIVMFEVSGVEVSRYVRESCPDCAVIFLSGYQDFEMAQQGIRNGVFDYLLKPIRPERLKETFARLRERLDQAGEARRQQALQTAAGGRVLELLEQIAGRCGLALPDGAGSPAQCIDYIAARCEDERVSGPLRALEAQSRLASAEYVTGKLTDLMLSLPESDESVVEQAKLYIQAHLSGDCSIDAVAGAVNLSARQLMRRFFECEGRTVGKYVLACRMEKAAGLIAGGQRSVAALSEQLGYGSEKYFRKVFAGYYGCTVGEYAHRRREEGR